MPNKNFENFYLDNGYNNIAGVDEAGRGALAGPVVAAAVILPKSFIDIGIDDSKKLSKSKREKYFQYILLSDCKIGIGIVDNFTIDKINILQATFNAMIYAVNNLSIKPDFLLIDGNIKPQIDIDSKTIIKGDGISLSIASASIIAKVTRDRLMEKLHLEYPIYNFASNKGYGTKEHIKALNLYRESKTHRLTFLRNIFQQKLF
jgi:ribonuclease HII